MDFFSVTCSLLDSAHICRLARSQWNSVCSFITFGRKYVQMNINACASSDGNVSKRSCITSDPKSNRIKSRLSRSRSRSSRPKQTTTAPKKLQWVHVICIHVSDFVCTVFFLFVLQNLIIASPHLFWLKHPSPTYCNEKIANKMTRKWSLLLVVHSVYFRI